MASTSTESPGKGTATKGVSVSRSLHAQYAAPLMHWLMFNIPGGPNCIPLCWVINFFKCLTLPWCFGLMWYNNNYSTTAYLMAALHGSYGVLWCVKHFVIPDTYWFTKATIPSAIFFVGPVLALYWSSSYIAISTHVVAPPHRIFVSVFLYVIGVVLMLAADTQKFFVLKVRKGLISDGWFSFCRNTNYLGEMMLYGAFALLAKHPFPLAIDISIWITLFAGRWALKEESFEKKAGGVEYIKSSSYILPTQWWALVVYAAFGYYMIKVY